jgi:hypothetical protein
MLLNEFLKEHRKVEQMEKQIERVTADYVKWRLSPPHPADAV